MSRVTPPVQKLTHAVRSLSSTAHRGSSLSHHSIHPSAQRLPRKLDEFKTEYSSRSEHADRPFHTVASHRPQAPRARYVPLMQGFRTTAPVAAVHDSSTIDFMFFPSLENDASSASNEISMLRVPLLPDNYSPDRSSNSLHAAESLDEAVAGPQIHIVAAHPEHVAPAAMSEVVGNESVEMDVGALTRQFVESASTPLKKLKEPGIISEVFRGMFDDVFGGSKRAAV